MKRAIYNEDHEAFRSSVKEFISREVEPHLEEHLANKEFGRDFWLKAGEAGLLGLEVPEEHGGMEAGDYRFNAVLMEELSHVNAALSSCVGIHADIVAPYLVELTTDEQKKRWLPGLASGELLCAIGMTPVRDTRPSVGFRPAMPFIAAGQVIEPSVSVPTAAAHRLAEGATPEPEEEPHGLRSRA